MGSGSQVEVCKWQGAESDEEGCRIAECHGTYDGISCSPHGCASRPEIKHI